MKIFLYKLLISVFIFFILYKFTIGQTIKHIETKLEYLISMDSIASLKEKIRDEIKSSLDKEKYISNEDAELINAFIDKVQKDLKNQN